MNELNDLSEKEQIVLSYMKAALMESIDPHDLRSDGVFSEMFLNPQVDLLLPILNYMDQVRLAQSLSNAKYISTERLDEIGYMFGNEREKGKRSMGYVTMIFDDIPDNGYINIPKGMSVSTREGLVFTVDKTYTYNEIVIAKYYDPSDYLYKIPVLVKSEGLGSMYNVDPNEISIVDSKSPEGLMSVTNEAKIIGGEDTEDNVTYAARIRRDMWSKNLGITRGYHTFVYSFEDVIDTEIVGYRHPMMFRDIIGDVSIPGVTMHEGLESKHWGSKVDIYIRGSKDAERSVSLEVKKDKDGTLYVDMIDVPVVGVRAITISSENMGLDPTEVDFERLVLDKYNIERTEDFETLGTLEEECRITFSKVQGGGDFEISEGYVVDIDYVYNELPQKMTEAMYGDIENRPPTADVKVKLAHKKNIALNITVGIKSGMDMQLSDVLSVKTHIKKNVDEVKMGSELQISDLVESVYTQKYEEEFNNINFVELPFHCLVFDNNNLLAFNSLSDEKKENILNLDVFKSNKDTFDYFCKEITVSEILDLLHIFSRRRVISDNQKDSTIKDRMNFYQQILETYKALNIPVALSPTTIKTNSIEYLVANHIKVFEYQKVNEEMWIDYDFQILATSRIGEDYKVKELAIFVFAIAFSAIEDYTNEKLEEKINRAATLLNVKMGG